MTAEYNLRRLCFGAEELIAAQVLRDDEGNFLIFSKGEDIAHAMYEKRDDGTDGYGVWSVAEKRKVATISSDCAGWKVEPEPGYEMVDDGSVAHAKIEDAIRASLTT